MKGFVFGKEAAIAGLLDHHLKLFGGAHHGVAVGCHHAESADDTFGDTVEQVNGPAKSVQEPVERPRDQQSDAFGAGEAEAFGDEFAEDDLQNREKSEDDD